MKLYAGFIKAERGREMVTIPIYCVADSDIHARSTLTTWARERWTVEKGWRLQQGFAREIVDDVFFMDERVAPLMRLIKLLE